MNLTIRLTSFLFLLLIFLGCNDGDLSVTDTNDLNNYEAFEDVTFNVIDDNNFIFEDCLFDDQNSIFMVGQVLPNPRVSKLESDFSVQFSNDILSDGQSKLRQMDLIKTADQNFMYCGEVFNDSSFDIDVRKYDSSGSLIWNSSIGESLNNESAISLAEVSNNRIVVLAKDSDFTVSRDSSFYLVTLDRNGELLSNLEIIDPEIHEMKKVLFSVSDNTILILGEHGFLGGFESYLKISKYSLNGELITSKIIIDDIDFFVSPSDMKIMEDGNIIIYTSSSTKDDPNNNTIQLFKLSKDLEDIWMYEYDDIKRHIVGDVQETAQGDLIILSYSGTVSDNGEFDVILSKLNEDLELEWIKSYGTTSSDQGRRLLIDENQDLIVVGNSNHNANFQNIFNYFVLKTDSEGVPK